MKKLAAPLSLIVLFLGLEFSRSVVAAPVDAAVERQILQRMKEVIPRFEVASVKVSPIEGLYEVQMVNGPMLLSTASADYFISGDVFTTVNKKLENVTEINRKQQRLTQLKSFDNDELIVFTPARGAKRWVAVFTDVQCGYCRKFHDDVPALNKMGIEVRYFSYPIFDGSREKMISALCAADSRKALTALKTGGSVPKNLCSGQSIDAQFALAREFGLSGTPAIVLDDGTLVKGYVEPSQLEQKMGL